MPLTCAVSTFTTSTASPRSQAWIAGLTLVGVYLAVFGPGIVASVGSVLGATVATDTGWQARTAAVEWDLFTVLIVVTVVLRWLPKHAPDVTVRMALRRSQRRPVPGGMLGASAGFVAVAVVSGRLGDRVVTALDLSSSGQSQVGTGLGSFLAGLSAAASASLTEEVVLVALAVAVLDQHAADRGGRPKWLVPAAVGLLFALRWPVHLYYLWGSVFVLLWVPGVYLLYRWVGSVWPLVLGHFGYDGLALAGHAFPSSAPILEVTIWGVAGCGAVALLVSVRRGRHSNRDGSPAPTLVTSG